MEGLLVLSYVGNIHNKTYLRRRFTLIAYFVRLYNYMQYEVKLKTYIIGVFKEMFYSFQLFCQVLQLYAVQGGINM